MAEQIENPKVFISQPMNGLSEETIRANRESVVKMLEEMGYEVLDSVFDFEDVEGVKNKGLFYLSESLKLIATEADCVFFMKGWKNARGCNLEHDCAVAYNILVKYEG